MTEEFMPEETIEKDARLYECIVLLAHPNPEEQKLLKEIEGIFTEVNAKLVEKDLWSRRGLAYPIHGQTEGKYIVYYYEMEPLSLQTVDEALRIAKGVLRHMLFKPPIGYAIVNFEEKFQRWIKERETEEQVRARQHEQELTEKVLQRAKHQAKQAETRRRAPQGEMEEKELEQQLEKIIADDDLHL